MSPAGCGSVCVLIIHYAHKTWKFHRHQSGDILRRTPPAAYALYKPEIGRREVTDVGKDSRQLRRTNAKPLRECCGILNARSSRDPTAIRARVVGPTERQRRERAIQLASLDRASDDHVVRTPRMVRAAI